MNHREKNLLETNVLMMREVRRPHFFVDRLGWGTLGKSHVEGLRRAPIMRASQPPFPSPRSLDAKWRNGIAVYAFNRLWTWVR